MIAKVKSKSVVILGTSSGVGKSLISTAICRILQQDGFSVAPFKAINISLNSGVTADGHEIATSQIVQAEACQIIPSVLMNPVLVKPQTGRKPQFILEGKVLKKKKEFWPVIKNGIDKILKEYGTIVIEGSGSPTELGYIDCDVANLKIAKYTKSPIFIVGDIDRGGVFASFVGTVDLLKKYDPESASQIRGFIINKYKGERKYLNPSIEELTKITGLPVVGVIPFLEEHKIENEDNWISKLNDTRKKYAVLDIAVIDIPTFQNTHEFDSLIQERYVQLRFVSNHQDFGTPDLVILPGSKSTIADLTWIREKGIDKLILNHAQNKKPILGICGGFQMLGDLIEDPKNIESSKKKIKGLGLLPIKTIFSKSKVVRESFGVISQNSGLLKGAKGLKVKGYEIHMGRTKTGSSPFVSNKDGQILGTYFHKILENDSLRQIVLQNLAKQKGIVLRKTKIKPKDKYDKLAKVVRDNIDMTLFYQILEKGI